MEFSVSAFTNRLFDYLVNSSHFPYMKGDYIDKNGHSQSDRQKHSKRSPLHLRQAIEEQKLIVGGDNTMSFEIGSGSLETTHPYYHILQNTYAIRKAGKGTQKTKGSQEKYKPQERDYERVYWSGKTFTKEYDRNVRGSRKPKNVSSWNNGEFVNRDANSYINVHYHYIDKILDMDVVNQLALEFGLRKPIKRDSGLGEEYSLQEESNFTTNMLDIFDSHNIGD